MTDWRKLCETCGGFGSITNSFGFGDQCIDCSSTGFVPVTTADLEALGDKFWKCEEYGYAAPERHNHCDPDFPNHNEPPHTRCGWRLLIPIPEFQPLATGDTQ